MSNNPKKSEIASERAILITVICGGVLAPLNSTMIAVAIPRLGEAFGVSLDWIGWLVTAYLIAMASLQPIAGKLGDRFGRRRLILGGLLYFGGASLGAAGSSSFDMLLFFRIQQALSAAVILPNGTALVREIVPAERRAGRFGLIGASMSLTAAAGPPLGGFLVEVADWYAIFYVNLAFVVPAFVLGRRVLPTTKSVQTVSGFDFVGAFTLAIIFVSASGLLIQSRDEGALSLLWAVPLVAIALLFLRYEWYHVDPVFQLRFFARPKFAAANGAVCLSNLAMYSTMLTVPIMLSMQGDWTSAQIGFVLTALMVTSMVFAPFGGYVADRWGRCAPAVGGLLFSTVGYLPLAIYSSGIDLWVLVASLSIAGIGLGLAGPGVQTSAVESVASHQAGMASGIYSTSRYLGSIVGSSVLIGLLEGHGDGFTTVFVMVTCSSLLSALVSLGLKEGKRHREIVGETV